jgi:glutamate transport system ATP-binding protein
MAIDPLIELRDVNKYFGELHVLQDVNVTVGRGEVVVVIGPSGSGKSTLCRAINRLEPIQPRSITLDGRPLPEEEGKSLARLRSDVRMVFQSFNLFAHRTHWGSLAIARALAMEPKASHEMGFACSAANRVVFMAAKILKH